MLLRFLVCFFMQAIAFFAVKTMKEVCDFIIQNKVIGLTY